MTDIHLSIVPAPFPSFSSRDPEAGGHQGGKDPSRPARRATGTVVCRTRWAGALTGACCEDCKAAAGIDPVKPWVPY